MSPFRKASINPHLRIVFEDDTSSSSIDSVGYVHCEASTSQGTSNKIDRGAKYKTRVEGEGGEGGGEGGGEEGDEGREEEEAE